MSAKTIIGCKKTNPHPALSPELASLGVTNFSTSNCKAIHSTRTNDNTVTVRAISSEMAMDWDLLKAN